VIAIIDYGAGNLRSIANGLRKVGADAQVVDEAGRLGDADAIVLPGVGSFGDAMEKLFGYRTAIVDAVDSGAPFLGLCLGIQVIFESSEESPGAPGLGLFKGTCRRFTGGLKVPHMGWNTITKVQDTPLLDGVGEGEHFYFVHSYHVVPNNASIVAAQTEYEVTFPSVISLKNVYATQFHPEKSGERGLSVLRNFVGLSRK
jgi:glutamine amidotransferase